MSNIITARFDGKTSCKTDPAYQYDYGQILYFSDLSLPTSFEVHFANAENGTSVTQIGSNNRVTIPDSVFQGSPNYYTKNIIYAWVFLHTGDSDGETEYRVTIPLTRRAEPSDDEPTPVQQSAITQAIAQLNNAVSTVEGYLGNYAPVVLGETQGNPIRITDGTDEVPVKSLVLQLTPKQSGTGTPSPSNVRAITGATGTNIHVTGKNLCEELITDGTWNNNVSATHTKSDGVLTIEMTSATYSGVYSPASSYLNSTLSVLTTNTVTYSFDIMASASASIYVGFNDMGASDKTIGTSWQRISITATPNGSHHAFVIYNMSGSAVTVSVRNLMFELGSTATDYEPYGTTYPVSWSSEAGTVYGGYVDVVSGTMTVTHGYVDMGTLAWNYVPSQTRFYAVLSTADMPTSSTEKADILCDRYAVTSFNDLQYGNENNVVAGYSNGTASFVQIRNTNYTTTSALTSALSGVYIYYPLATPLTYSITPVEISTILGLNNIWSDTGFINPLVYCLDTKTYIEQNSVKAPSIVPTVSGSIASFSDGADSLNMESLVVNIEPKQSGSGTPSPSNIRAISGWTGCNAYVTGINVWDEEWELGYIVPSTGALNARTDRIRSKNFIRVEGNKAYYFNTSGEIMNTVWYDANQEYIRNNSPSNEAITSPSDAVYMKFSMPSDYGTTYSNDISINYPSTDTSYHAYQGTTYPVTWSDNVGTIYAGYADIVKGTLTQTHKMVTLTGSEYWMFDTVNSNKNRAIKELNDAVTGTYTTNIKGNYISASESATSTPDIWKGNINNNGALLIGIPTSIASKNDWTTYLASHNLQVVYPLATPVTYTIGTEQIKSLLGLNNVFADCGSIASCKYVADTKKYIDNAIATAIASL